MFYEQKLEILHNLSNNVDFSPKGSIDAPVAELVSFINSLDGYVTTSSCSGRISIYRSNGDILRANNSNKGVLWLMVSHRLVAVADIQDLLNREMTSRMRSTDTEQFAAHDGAGDLAYLKCEGFILHVLCKDLESATKLLQVALQVGYRESGITIGGSYQSSTVVEKGSKTTQKHGKSSVMLAIRSTAFTFEVPIAIIHGNVWTPLVGMEIPDTNNSKGPDVRPVYPFGLELLVDQANDKLKQNFSRVDKLMTNLKTKLVQFPVLHVQGEVEKVYVRDAGRRWGHASAAFANVGREGGVVTLGGYESSGNTSVRAKKLDVVAINSAVVPMAPSTTSHKLNGSPSTSSTAGGIDTEFVHSTLNACSLGWINLGGRKAPSVKSVLEAELQSGSSVSEPESFIRILDGDMKKLLRHLDINIGGALPPRWGHSCTRLARKEDEVYEYDQRCSGASESKMKDSMINSDKYLVFGGRSAQSLCASHYLLERVSWVDYLRQAGTNTRDAAEYPGGVWKWTRLDFDLDDVALTRCYHAAVLLPNSPYSMAVLIHGGLLRAPMTAEAVESTDVDSSMLVIYPLDVAEGHRVRCSHIQPNFPSPSGNGGGFKDSRYLSGGIMARFGHTITDIGAKCLLLCGGISPHDTAESNNISIPNSHAATDNLPVTQRSTQSEFMVCLDVTTMHNFTKDNCSEVVITLRRVLVPDPVGGGCAVAETSQRVHHQTLLIERAIDFEFRGSKQSKGGAWNGRLVLPLPCLMLIGGGSQCLSFGTFFNDSRTFFLSSSEYVGGGLQDVQTNADTRAQSYRESVQSKIVEYGFKRALNSSVGRTIAVVTCSDASAELHAVLICAKSLTKRIKSLLETVTAAQIAGVSRAVTANASSTGMSRCARKHGYYDKTRRINAITALQLMQLQMQTLPLSGEPSAQSYIRTLTWKQVNSYCMGSYTESPSAPEATADDLVALPITIELEHVLLGLCTVSGVGHTSQMDKSQIDFVTELFKLRSFSDLLFGRLPADLLFSGATMVSKSQSVKTILSEWYNKHGIEKGMDKTQQEVFCYPKKFELVGNDVVMIPSESLLNELYEEHLSGNGQVSENSLTELWSLLAAAFGCSRIARKAEISSNLRRESRVKLLYKSPEFETKRRARVLEASRDPDVPDPQAVEKSEGWVTVIENKVKFGFDISKVMFCSGNCTERMRMGRVKCKNEVIYDLYCGIGYYTVPLLFYGGAKHVYACEWNPNSVAALKSNLNYQRIHSSRATIIEGDNRVNVPQLQLRNDDGDLTETPVHVMASGDRSYQMYPHYNSQTINELLKASSGDGNGLLPRADRVMLGLLPSSRDGWKLGVSVLKLAGGIMHVHENVHERLLVKPNPTEAGSSSVFETARDVPTAELTVETDGYFPDFLVRRMKVLFQEHDERRVLEQGLSSQSLPPMDVRVTHVEIVKSYAPRVYHIVVDLICERIG